MISSKAIAIYSQVEPGQHVLFWDVDRSCDHGDITVITNILEDHDMQATLWLTERGFHIVGFHIHTEAEVQAVQEDLSRAFPSDYPTIQQLRKEYEASEDVFLGCCLRILGKGMKPLYVGLLGRYGLNGKPYSLSHRRIYQSLTDRRLHRLDGRGVETSLAICGYDWVESMQNNDYINEGVSENLKTSQDKVGR